MIPLPRKQLFMKLGVVCVLLTVSVHYFYVSISSINIHQLLERFIDQENYNVKADKWIIIDVTGSSRDNQHLNLPGWRILVLGDTTRNKIRCRNCVHYDKHSSAKIGKLFVSYSDNERIKIEGVLYAISSGAIWIFWSNDINDIQEEVNQFKMAELQTGLIYKGKSVMNPAHHFCSHRGKTKELTYLYELCSWSVPSIQKVWRPETFEKLPNRVVDYYSPPVLVQSPAYHTDSLIGSLFHRNLSWSLAPLFNAPQDRICVLSIWIQRLLWEFDGTTEFLTPLRNIHSKNVAINSKEEQKSLTVLRTKLSIWKCDVKSTFNSCVNQLADVMEQWKYFTKREVTMIKDWTSLLDADLPFRNPRIDKPNICGLRVAYNSGWNMFINVKETKTKYEPVLVENQFYSECTSNKWVQQTNQSKVLEMTSNQSKVLEMTSKPPIDDIMLVIIFNTRGYLYNIKYLHYMYGRHFSHILICGDSLDEFMKYELTQDKVTFIEMNLNLGYFGYQCMMEAMRVGYNVEGYLQMSDDVLLNVWNIGDLPRNRPWFQETVRVGSLDEVRVISYEKISNPKRPIYWSGWRIPEGRRSLLKLWEHFSVVLKDPKADPRIVTFLKILEINAGSNNSAFYEGSDIFYIPSSLKPSFVMMSSLFLKHTIHLEIGVPTLINGLVPKQEIMRMPGSYLWGWDRGNFEKKFNSSHLFLHAFKLSYTFKFQAGKRFFCTIYLPKIDNHLKELGFKTPVK